MNMTLDELVNAQIRDYLKSEDFIDKYDTQQVITDEIESSFDIDEITDQVIDKLEMNDTYATTEYVDEEIREQVRSTIDADEYATEEFVRDKITALRKELHLEGLVPAEKEKPVNQLDQFVSPDGFIAGYHDFETLTTFMGASLADPNQKQMVVAMVLATARNIIQEQLNNDH